MQSGEIRVTIDHGNSMQGIGITSVRQHAFIVIHFKLFTCRLLVNSLTHPIIGSYCVK